MASAAACLQMAMGSRWADAREAGAIAGDAKVGSPTDTSSGDAATPTAAAAPPTTDEVWAIEHDGATSRAEPIVPDASPAPEADALAVPRVTGSTRTPMSRRVSRPPPAIAHAANEVSIRLVVEPAVATHVFWGVKDLGATPLEIVRPRGSGPLDLSVRAPGYLTFHTRAYTDRDDKIAIRMVPFAQAAGTFGYRRAGNLQSGSGKSAELGAGSRRGNPADRAIKR
jgi:hypothetical protein